MVYQCNHSVQIPAECRHPGGYAYTPLAKSPTPESSLQPAGRDSRTRG